MQNDAYPVKQGLVLSNEREIKEVGKICYMPIYNVMFFKAEGDKNFVDFEKKFKENIKHIRETNKNLRPSDES